MIPKGSAFIRASLVSIDADTTEMSACQKMRMDGRTDRQTAFQLYIIDDVKMIMWLYAFEVCDFRLSKH